MGPESPPGGELGSVGRVLTKRSPGVKLWANAMLLTPTSMEVENLISTANKIKSPQRLSIAQGTVDDWLEIACNMPTASEIDVRPLVGNWLFEKKRRQREVDIKTATQRHELAVVFPRDDNRTRVAKGVAKKFLSFTANIDGIRKRKREVGGDTDSSDDSD